MKDKSTERGRDIIPGKMGSTDKHLIVLIIPT